MCIYIYGGVSLELGSNSTNFTYGKAVQLAAVNKLQKHINDLYGIQNGFAGLLRKAMCNIVGHVVVPYGITPNYSKI